MCHAQDIGNCCHAARTLQEALAKSTPKAHDTTLTPHARCPFNASTRRYSCMQQASKVVTLCLQTTKPLQSIELSTSGVR
jgi:hypothetical protein